jgi:sterol desaturase/sphingolipid hydroxylase (fatty acid hydroxylase superfamily)
VIQVRRATRRMSLLAFLDYAFPLAAWRQKSARMDVVLYLLTKVTDRVLSPFMICAVTVFSITMAILARNLPAHAPLQLNLAILLVCSVVAFVIVDFANYLSHYMQHFVPVLWELHKVHHSATFLSPITTGRMHPLGNAFDTAVSGTLVGIPFGIFGFLYGLSIPDLILLLASANTFGTILVLDSLRHSQFPVSFGRFDRVLLSPHMHQLHHSCRIEHWDKNFGNKLSVWDWAFGTAYLPARDEHIPYGLGKPEENDYNNVVGASIGPLRKMVALLWQAGRRDRSARGSGGERAALAEGILWRDRAERYPAYGPPADDAVACAKAGQLE